MKSRTKRLFALPGILLVVGALSLTSFPSWEDAVLAAAPANLAVVSLSGPPTAAQGSDIAGQVSLTIRNSGATDITGDFYIGFYLSPDAAITTADRLLVKGRKTFAGLPAGGTAVVPIDSLRIPMSTPLGGNFLGVIVDEYDRVAESNEGDNTASGPITISTTQPDSIVWVRQFGTTQQDHASGLSAVDSTALFVAGKTLGVLPGQAGGGGTDAYLRKYDASGAEVWTQQFGTAMTDRGAAVATNASAVYVAGGTDGSLPGYTNAGGFDAFVRKYDFNGVELWTRQFGTSVSDEATGVALDATGVYVSGFTTGTLPGETSAGGTDAFVRKYALDGTVVWTRQYGTPGIDEAFAVSVDATGIYVVGRTDGVLPGQSGAGAGDAYIRKYDTDGSELWTRQFGSSGSDDAFGIHADGSGAYIAGRTSGVLAGQVGAGGTDAFVRRYDLGGNVVWTRQFGTSLGDEACGVSVSAQGVCVSGFTAGGLPGHISAGSNDPFLVVYDIDGNEILSRQFGTANDDRSLAIASSPLGVHVAGYTSGTLPGQVSEGLDDAFTVFDDDDDDDDGDERNLKVVAFDGPASVSRGDSIGDRVTLSIINSGPKRIKRDFSVGLYISPDTTITLGDLFLTDGRVTVLSPMEPNEVRAITFPTGTALPDSAPTGNVFLGVVLDEFNDIEEEHAGAEDDNTAHVPVAVNADTDGDGVLDADDLCPTEDASFFDRDGDGCIDDIQSARHLEYWPPEDLPLPYFVHENGAPGIGDGSDFAALQAGMDAWSSIPGADVSASFQGTTTQVDAQAMDGINLITFDDPDFTFPAGVLAVGISTSFTVPTMFGGTLARPGQIVDADVLFNPTKSFRTATAGSGTDIESVTTHEAGHLFGISHSAVQTSTMFFVLPPDVGAATLEPEDESMMLKSYPSASALATMSRLTGTVRDGSDLSPVPGVIVYVISVATGDTVANDYTLPPTGTFEFLGIPDGDYDVAIHPLNGTSPIGFIGPQNINQLIFDQAVTTVVPEFWDLAESKNDDPTASDPVTVLAGTATHVDIITNVDETGPAVTQASPGDSELGVSIDAAVLVSFSEAIESGSVQGNFALTDTAAGQFIPGSAAVLEDDSTLAFLPSGNLSFDTVYELVLGTGLTDQFGNPLQAPFVLHFTTQSQPPVGITSLAPTHGPAGTPVTISGFGFEATLADNIVTFGGVSATVLSASPSQLVFEVPVNAAVGGTLVSVTNVPQAATSNELAYTVLPVDDVAKGFEAAVVSLGALPRAVDIVPNGSRTFIATNAGASVVVVDPGLTNYLSHTPIGIPGGLNAIAATPNGKFAYAVSRLNQKFYRINADPANGPLAVLDERGVGAVPRGLLIEPTGRRAFVTTDASEIQVWDINEGSATFDRQVGAIVSPPNLRARMATNPAGNLLLALSGVGKLLVFDLDLDSLVAEVNVGPDPRDVVVDPAGQRAYVTDEFGFATVVGLTSFSVVTDIPTGGNLRGGMITPSGNFLYAANRQLDILDVIDLREGSPTFRTVAADIAQRANPVDLTLSPDGIFAFSLSEAEQAMVVTGIGLGPTLRSLSRRAGPAGARLVLAGEDFTGDVSTTVSFNGTIAVPERTADSSLTVAVPAGAASGPVTVRVTNSSPPVEVSNAIFFEVLELPTPAGGLRLAAKAQPAGAPQLSRALAISPDGRMVAVGGDAGELFLLDADAASPTFNRFIGSAAPLSSPLADVAITPDGRRAFLLSEGEPFVPVVDIDRNSTSFASVVDSVDFSGGGSVIDRLRISPDGFLLLVSDPGITGVHVVDIRPGSPQENQIIATTPAADVPQNINGMIGEMEFHPAGEFAYLAVQDDDPAAILVMDVGLGSPAFGTIVHTMGLSPGAPVPQEVPISLSFTPDGSRCFVLTTQRTLSPNRTMLTLLTSAPGGVVSPVLELTQPFPTASAAADEHVHVSPRGDRAVLNVLGDGFSHLDITTSPLLTVLDQSAGALHQGAVDFDYSPEAARLYATGPAQDTVYVYDFTLAQELVEVSGDSLTGVINQTLPEPLRVKVINMTSGNPSAGVAVTFDVSTGGGSFATADPAVNPATQVVVTGTDGIAEVNFRLGPVVGDAAHSVVASSLGLTGSPITFIANALNDPDSLPLSVSGIIPVDGLAGVNITTAIQTTFSRSVDTSTVDTSTYFLRESVTLARVPAIVGFTDENRKLSLSPDSALEPGKTYSVVVTTGIISALGDALSAGATASFTTVPPPPLALSAVSPPSAAAKVGIVLSGTSFDPVPANNTVLFDAVQGVVTDAGCNFVNVNVPLLAATGDVRVVVGPDTSNALPFTVLAPSLSPADDVLGSVGTGSSTRSLAIIPDGSLAYGVSPDQGTVVPIDLVSLASLPSIAVGDNPFAIIINPDGTFAYVANFLSGTVSIIDVDPNSPGFNSVAGTLVVGANPIDLLITPDGDRVIVANAGSSDLSVIDSNNLSETFHSVLATVGRGTSTRSLSITPDGGLLYVGTDTGYIVLDALDFGVLASVGRGTSTRSLSITPDGTLLVVLTTEGDVDIVDIVPGSPSENQVLASVGRGTSTRSLSITPDGAFLWLVQDEADVILVVALDIANSVSALDPNTVLTPATLTPVDTIATGPDPAEVAFDPSGTGVAVVTNAGDNTMSILGVLADVFVQARPFTPAEPPFRDIRAAIELPASFNPNDIDLGTLTLNGLVPGTSKPPSFTDGDEDGLTEIHVEFDRVQYQNVVGQGDSVEVFVGGLVGGQEFSGTDFIRTFRPTLIFPNGEPTDTVFAGDMVDILWQAPSFSPIDAVDFWWTGNDGRTWNPIVTAAPPGTGALTWYVPGQPTDSARVMLVLYTNNDGLESIGAVMSANLFRIQHGTVPVALGSFVAVAADRAAVLKWRTHLEIDFAGFHVLRSDYRDFGYERVTPGLIPSSGRETGSSYEFRDTTVRPSRTYYYKLEEITGHGKGEIFGPFEFTYRAPFALDQNFPNPFNPTTTIRFTVARDGHVKLVIYDVGGRRVRTLLNEDRIADHYEIDWDGKNGSGQSVASGVYFYKIVSGKFTKTRKMLLLK
ncbi:MAG: Ig-like domain-containing protein [Candidatus Krumholzibacteriia bacterium]